MSDVVVPRPTPDDWQRQTQALLPPGIAWSRDPTSNIGKIMGTIASERALNHTAKLALLDTESVPTSAQLLLADWEQSAGLPDPCRPLPGSIGQRWLALADIYFADHPPTPANMIAWAATAGWTITIREQTAFTADVSVGDEAAGEDDFTWVVTVGGQVIEYFMADKNSGGDPLWVGPDLVESVGRRRSGRAVGRAEPRETVECAIRL